VHMATFNDIINVLCIPNILQRIVIQNYHVSYITCSNLPNICHLNGFGGFDCCSLKGLYFCKSDFNQQFQLTVKSHSRQCPNATWCVCTSNNSATEVCICFSYQFNKCCLNT